MWLLLSICAAFSFGIRGIMYQWTSKKPADRNLVLFGTFLSAGIFSFVAAVAMNHAWRPETLIGCLMGVWSFAGNASMYKGFSVGKASLVAIFTALPPVVAVAMAYLLWNETLSSWQLVAFLIILTGVLLIRYSNDLDFHQLQGIKWAILSMFMFGFNDTSSKQAMLLGADVFPTMFFMFATGTILFGLFWLRGRAALKNRPFASLAERETSATVGQPKRWKTLPTLLWGCVIGVTNFFGMIFLLSAMKTGLTGLVSAISALNVLFVIAYAGLFLKERFSLKEWLGFLCAIGGIVILHLVG